MREDVLEHLRDEDAVLVVDETGDVGKGIHTVGVQRRYTGTAGRIENAQVPVYLVSAGSRGHAAVDRELYVPRSWTSDPARCRAADLNEDTVFATEPEPAARMTVRFLDGGHRAGWVTGDEVYGGNPKLLSALEERQAGYVLAVACSAEVATAAGKFRADSLAAKVPRRAWRKLSAGGRRQGAPFLRLGRHRPGRSPARQPPAVDPPQPHHRRTGLLPLLLTRPGPLATLVRVAGSRRRVEETFQAGKGLAGLDEHQVRHHTPRSRRVAPAMLAHAFLAVVRADEHARHPAPDELIPLTCDEIQRLSTALVVQPVHGAAHLLARSTWRRRHRARARTGHYHRQTANQT
ncbi:IS701 family transposase [Streptomyces sp. NPDC007910]|uniref:IS701 family transposase n=1 Tax=Streptomyces sp. NPDC007910 TaxID=3364790 RepID=UPI0036F086C4